MCGSYSGTFYFGFAGYKVWSKRGLDVAVATQLIVTTGGIFGASIIFYLNKSKIEKPL